jgi:fructokinase
MSVVCFGELLIDFVALETGVSVGEASGFQKSPGGAPANVAVAVARLGRESAFLGQVGDDPFGHFLADLLDAEGVDIGGLRFSAEARTALAFVSLTAEGERSFVFYRHPSADMLMRPEDVELGVMQGKRMFHFGSITLIHEPSRSATLMAAQHAFANQMLISYDPNLRMSLWSSADAAREGMLVGLNYAHLVKLSDEELVFLTGGHKVDPLWREHMQMIVVTHGSKGATAFTVHTRKEEFHVPGFSVRSVDTTGAGDAFVAGMLVGILDHWGDHLTHLPEILRFANAVGALSTTNRGAIPALPSHQAVEAFMRGPG